MEPVKLETLPASTGLRIQVSGVPPTGAKSRVETHIKLCLALVDGNGRKLSHWRYLALPQHLLPRDRQRMAGQQRSPQPACAPAEVLTLEAAVVCASAPSVAIEMCNSCVAREVRRALGSAHQARDYRR